MNLKKKVKKYYKYLSKKTDVYKGLISLPFYGIDGTGLQILCGKMSNNKYYFSDLGETFDLLESVRFDFFENKEVLRDIEKKYNINISCESVVYKESVTKKSFNKDLQDFQNALIKLHNLKSI